MVAAIIIALHVALVLGAFVWKLRTDGIAEAILASGFIVIIFSVGWTLSGLAVGLLFEPQGLAEWMNRDTISLTLVMLGEGVFYAVFLRFLRTKPGGDEKL